VSHPLPSLMLWPSDILPVANGFDRDTFQLTSILLIRPSLSVQYWDRDFGHQWCPSRGIKGRLFLIATVNNSILVSPFSGRENGDIAKPISIDNPYFRVDLLTFEYRMFMAPAPSSQKASPQIISIILRGTSGKNQK
jgi:hypothetical protein